MYTFLRAVDKLRTLQPTNLPSTKIFASSHHFYPEKRTIARFSG